MMFTSVKALKALSKARTNFIRRHHSCKGKTQHKSMGAAEAHIRSLARLQDNSEMASYFCVGCHSWHVGHAKEAR
jgi:hypothetical protein